MYYFYSKWKESSLCLFRMSEVQEETWPKQRDRCNRKEKLLLNNSTKKTSTKHTCAKETKHVIYTSQRNVTAGRFGSSNFLGIMYYVVNGIKIIYNIYFQYRKYLTKYTYLLIHEAEPVLRSRQFCSHSRTSKHFTEPEGSIPCSQEPSTSPCPEPYQSSPHHSNLSL
jgi:hypothetical protein